MNQVDRLLINLKIIASLEPYQKLNTKSGHQLVIESAWTSTSIYRWARADTRHNTVKRIGEILEEANNILRVGASTNSQEYVSDEYRSRVMSQLNDTRTGMVNLRTTYESDRTITAHFDVLLERIDTMLSSRYTLTFTRHATREHVTVNRDLKINTMSSDDSSGSTTGESSPVHGEVTE